VSEWIIRPGELLMEGGPQGVGTQQGGKFHDFERGAPLPRAGGSNLRPMHPGLCPHKQNPANCLQCYHAKASAPPAAPPPRRGPQVQTSPVVAAVKARAGVGASPMGQLVPHVDAPVHLGKTPDGKDIEPPKREPTRGKMPVPVLHGPNAQAGQGAHTKTIKPFSYANDDGRVDRKGLWHPAKHRSLVDALPSHPDAPKR
jgi:hypothetical protein